MIEGPFLYQSDVPSDWVDYNGHMNDAAYAKMFSLAVDAFMDDIGLNAEARDKYAYSIYTIETHLCYLREAHEGEKLSVNVQLLDVDEKRLHVIFEMKNSDHTKIATSEQMLMGIDMRKGTPASFPPDTATIIEELWENDKSLEAPKQAGRRIGMK